MEEKSEIGDMTDSKGVCACVSYIHTLLPRAHHDRNTVS